MQVRVKYQLCTTSASWMRSCAGSSFFAELLGFFCSICRLLRAALSCEVLELNPPLVLYEGWEELWRVVPNQRGALFRRLVLDATVNHLNKSVVFILFIDTAAECTLAWHDESRKSRRRRRFMRRRFMRSVFAIFRMLNFTKST
jgi:hypothetical protein